MNPFTEYLKLKQHGNSTIYFNKKINVFSKLQKMNYGLALYSS